TVSSLPDDLRRVVLCLAHGHERGVSVESVRSAIERAHPDTARNLMERLEDRGVALFTRPGQGRAATLSLLPEWAFCRQPEYRVLLTTEPVDNPGVCASTVPRNLVQRHIEEEREEEKGEEYTHPPEIDRLDEVQSRA